MITRWHFQMTALVWLFLVVTACASPVAMHRAVIEYDRTISQVETELLLLNIARVRHHYPIHFTAVSSIAATFDFRINTGVTGAFAESPGTDSLTLTLGTTAAENPTVSIIPIQGEEFAKRLLTPIEESKVEFLAHQGIDPGILFRLMARGIYVEEAGEEKFFLNLPHRKDEYQEFRRRILHLSSLKYSRDLYIGALRFMDGEKPVIGRILIANYDFDKIPNADRQALHAKAQRYPLNHVLVDIKPGFPGGEYPFQGYIKLRSFKGILGFIGRGIAEEPEFAVAPDPRTGQVLANPIHTLFIQETPTPPSEAMIQIREQGYWYSISLNHGSDVWETRWNHEAFDVLYQLFHLTVTDVGRIPTPAITIAK